MAHRWYVIHVYLGFERQVADKIEEQALQSHLAEEIENRILENAGIVEKAMMEGDVGPKKIKEEKIEE